MNLNSTTPLDSIVTPRADILQEDIRLVKQSGVYWALDTKTGAIVGRASRDPHYSPYGRWTRARRFNGEIRYSQATRCNRLLTIVGQWARNYV